MIASRTLSSTRDICRAAPSCTPVVLTGSGFQDEAIVYFGAAPVKATHPGRQHPERPMHCVRSPHHDGSRRALNSSGCPPSRSAER